MEARTLESFLADANSNQGEGGGGLFWVFFVDYCHLLCVKCNCSQGRVAAGGNRPSSAAFCGLGLSVSAEELLQTI